VGLARRSDSIIAELAGGLWLRPGCSLLSPSESDRTSGHDLISSLRPSGPGEFRLGSALFPAAMVDT
jgi:hypothetical protein